MLTIGDTVEMHGSLVVDEFHRYFHVSKHKIHDRVEEVRFCDFVKTLIYDRHDTDLFFEVFFGLFFLIEFRVCTGKSDLHIDETSHCENLIGETKELQEEIKKNDENDDVYDHHDERGECEISAPDGTPHPY